MSTDRERQTKRLRDRNGCPASPYCLFSLTRRKKTFPFFFISVVCVCVWCLRPFPACHWLVLSSPSPKTPKMKHTGARLFVEDANVRGGGAAKALVGNLSLESLVRYVRSVKGHNRRPFSIPHLVVDGGRGHGELSAQDKRAKRIQKEARERERETMLYCLKRRWEEETKGAGDTCRPRGQPAGVGEVSEKSARQQAPKSRNSHRTTKVSECACFLGGECEGVCVCFLGGACERDG